MLNNDFQNDLKIYKNDVKSKLLCDSKISKTLFKDLQNDIDNYIEDNNVTSIEEIYNHFGSADDIATAFLDTVDIAAVKRKMNIKKLIAVLVAAVIIIWGIGMTVIVMNSKKADLVYEVHYGLEEESDSLNNIQET